MNRKPKIIVVVVVVLVLGIGVGGGVLWHVLQSKRQAEIDAAYQDFLPEGSWPTSHRYHHKELIFTDGVERFRFDGANQALVDHLVQRYELARSAEPASSSFRAPQWWRLPEGGECYLRGSGHQYFMLVFDREAGRIFFEATQD